MFTVNRWWERYGIQMSLVLLAVGGAWTLRQTQGAALTEVYQVISRPFQVSPVKAERLSDARTLELQTRLQEVESQNTKLKELLGYVGQAKVKGAVVAPIIGRSADQWWQQFTLGRGSSQGIKEGDIVNAPGGLVGRIVSVTNNTSRVLLVSDPSSQLGVTISRTRNMGFLRGDSRSRAVMQFFDKVPDVKPGDVIATSPYSQMFPAGLPVGRVESVDMKKTPAPVAVIELSAPMDYLEWVVVSPKTENPK
jgi:rod shape-determining protein MreC